MPKTELPSTLKRSPEKAQRTYRKTLSSAEERYGDGERAHRTAFATLKRKFEKKGGRWVAKGHSGPSDPRSKKSSAAKRRNEGKTYGGVDAEGNTRKELYQRARKLDIEGRSKMNKGELAEAIGRQQ
jgi:cation transport regulator ChaB